MVYSNSCSLFINIPFQKNNDDGEAEMHSKYSHKPTHAVEPCYVVPRNEKASITSKAVFEAGRLANAVLGIHITNADESQEKQRDKSTSQINGEAQIEIDYSSAKTAFAR